MISITIKPLKTLYEIGFTLMGILDNIKNIVKTSSIKIEKVENAKEYKIMNYSPIDVANYFLSLVDEESGDNITHLKLQKLVYYADAWFLALYNKSLFKENFEAWVHGPVLTSLYQKFKDYGYNPINSPEEYSCNLPEEVKIHLDEIWEEYGSLSPKKLEILTHSEAPWKEARKNCSPIDYCSNNLSKDLMRTFYAARINEQEN